MRWGFSWSCFSALSLVPEESVDVKPALFVEVRRDGAIDHGRTGDTLHFKTSGDAQRLLSELEVGRASALPGLKEAHAQEDGTSKSIHTG